MHNPFNQRPLRSDFLFLSLSWLYLTSQYLLSAPTHARGSLNGERGFFFFAMEWVKFKSNLHLALQLNRKDLEQF